MESRSLPVESPQGLLRIYVVLGRGLGIGERRPPPSPRRSRPSPKKLSTLPVEFEIPENLLVERRPRRSATDVFPRLLAQGYALSGDAERAVHWLAVAVDRGFINHPFLARHDPFFESLRNHRGFQELMETVRVRWEAFEP